MASDSWIQRLVSRPRGRSIEIGERVVRLLADPTWIQRRVETISLRPGGETRRRVSFDFTLPPELVISPGELLPHREVVKHARAGSVVIPLCFMRKSTLVDLDVTDDTGKSLPVLSLGQNGQLVETAMRYLLESLGGHPIHNAALAEVIYSRIDQSPVDADVESQRRDTFSAIARTAVGDPQTENPSPLQGDPNVKALASWLKAQVEPDRRVRVAMLASLLSTMSDSYVFAIEVNAAVVASRAIVKVGYASRVLPAKRRLGMLRHSEQWILGVATAAANSTHLEIETTPNLQVSELAPSRDARGTSPFAHKPVVAANRLHVFAGRSGDAARVFTELRVTVVPVRQGVVWYALVAALANFVAQVFLAFLGSEIVDRAYRDARVSSGGHTVLSEVAERLGPVRDTTAASTISLSLSLVAAVLLVAQLHDLERKVTRTSRFIVFFSALLFATTLMSYTLHSWMGPIGTSVPAQWRDWSLLLSVILVTWAAWITNDTGRSQVSRNLLESSVPSSHASLRKKEPLAATESALFEGMSVGSCTVISEAFPAGRKNGNSDQV